MVSIKNIYTSLSAQLRSRLTRVQFIMFVATVTGTISGLIAVLLKTLVHYLRNWLENIDIFPYAFLFFPAVGLLLTVFIINRFFHGQIERGIAMVLKSIARRSSFIPFSHTYVHVFTSALTVGFGGSAGLEAPIVATGSAIGSNVSRINELNYRERTLLIACGAAAGIAAVFNAPIAGLIFAIEVLLTETIVSYFIPLITSSVIGALCSKIILKESILFNFTLKQNFDYRNVPFYILLGLAAGFISLYYARTFKRVENSIHHNRMNSYLRAGLGGLILLFMYLIFPPLFGEGYNSVKMLANGVTSQFNEHSIIYSHLPGSWRLLVFTGLILLMKPVAAGVTIGSGGNGGNFAPSLFAGSYLGFFFSRLSNTTGFVNLPEGNFTLVGMAGVLSGVMYCPLTAIFLIAEITNGYGLFIPLMIVSSISYFIVKHYEPYSMETKRLAMEGQIFTHQKEKNILTSISLADMLDRDYRSVSMNEVLQDLVEVIKQSERNVFAVLDEKERFAGIIELNDIKQKLFQQDQFNLVPIRSLMKRPPAMLSVDMDMPRVMEIFDLTHSWQLPVLDKDKQFLGFVSKSKLFSRYREILASQADLYETVIE